MRGEKGLFRQLERNAGQPEIQWTLWNWLRARCRTKDSMQLYKEALRRYISSQGSEICMVGILLRDTEPDERDLSTAGRSLAECLSVETRVELTAWYLPIPAGSWPSLLKAVRP